MGTFFVAPRSLPMEACRRLDQLHLDHGFQRSRQLDCGDVSLYLYRSLSGTGGYCIETADGGFACLAGELVYRGDSGETALRRYVADLAARQVDARRLVGQFALIVKDARGLRLVTDPLGCFQVYLNAEAGLVSSSFWALLELLPKTSIDPEGVYEYAWTGAAYGGKTFVREISRLPAGAEVTLGSALTVTRAAAPFRDDSPARPAALDDLVEDHATRLRDLFADLARAYGERLRVSFSSGFDSRLIVAGLKSAGLRPDLFVYGDEDSIDVAVAREVAAGEKLRLDVIDKPRLVDPAAAASPERQQGDFLRFDGWKVDGIFDDGVDTPDRLRRHRDGGVPLNGSLGEIYRNFFYIPDRPMALKQVAQSFFSTCAPAACTEAFSMQRYLADLVRAFQAELGSDDTHVSRARVESLYPLVRGRYWTGRDVTINLRFGAMHFPFMNAQLVAGTAAIPIAFKNHGRYEARLIERLDPALAGYSSGYGYRFSAPPPLKHRAKSWLTLVRPPWLRSLSYRLRFARPQPFPGCLSPERLAPLVDPDLPIMRAYFRPARLHDPAAFNRVATMEYIFQRYGGTG